MSLRLSSLNRTCGTAPGRQRAPGGVRPAGASNGPARRAASSGAAMWPPARSASALASASRAGGGRRSQAARCALRHSPGPGQSSRGAAGAAHTHPDAIRRLRRQLLHLAHQHRNHRGGKLLRLRRPRRASREHAASGGARSLVRTQRRASGAHGAAARGGAAAWRRGRRGGAHGRTIASVSELGRCGRCATRRRAYRRGAQPRRGARREERPSECRRDPLARAASNGWILKLRRAPDSLTGCRSALARAAPTTALRR